jgi:putative mRNA 3-end processing factor
VLTLDDAGLYCARGGFHVDPVKPVERGLFTGEHKKIPGCKESHDATTKGELTFGDVRVTFHASGFAPGSGQVRIQDGETWVVTGDWKRAPDPLAAPFEPLHCDVLVTTAHFALPIFRWEEPAELARWLDAHENAVLFASPVLALALQAGLGRPLRRHEELAPLARRWKELGARLPASDAGSKRLLAPLAARGRVKVRGAVTAIAAGTARIRGTRRRGNFDAGFALSEHADWPATLRMVEETGARRVLVREGHAEPLARYLREQGLESEALPGAGSR